MVKLQRLQHRQTHRRTREKSARRPWRHSKHRLPRTPAHPRITSRIRRRITLRPSRLGRIRRNLLPYQTNRIQQNTKKRTQLSHPRQRKNRHQRLNHIGKIAGHKHTPNNSIAPKTQAILTNRRRLTPTPRSEEKDTILFPLFFDRKNANNPNKWYDNKGTFFSFYIIKDF